MIYEKLPVVLLSALASEKRNSTNAFIAEYILTHRRAVAELGIKELAERCHVGTGTVSRFCKEIGLEDFAELKRLLADASFHFQTVTEDTDSWMEAWNAHVSHSLSLVSKSVDEGKLEALCRDIQSYGKVSAYGMLKAQSAAINLQVDLLMLGKRIDTCTSYAEQINRILSAGEDELILVFSYTGAYFDYPNLRGKKEALMRPKIWMVCSASDTVPEFVDDTVHFRSPHDQLSHPYQLEAVASLIAQKYACDDRR